MRFFLCLSLSLSGIAFASTAHGAPQVRKAVFRHGAPTGRTSLATQSVSFKGRRLIFDAVWSRRAGGGLAVLVRGLARGKEYAKPGWLGPESMVIDVKASEQKRVARIAHDHYAAQGGSVVEVKFGAY